MCSGDHVQIVCFDGNTIVGVLKTICLVVVLSTYVQVMVKTLLLLLVAMFTAQWHILIFNSFEL